MNAGLEQVTARRSWFVPGFVVWGLPVWETIDFLAIEKVDSTLTIYSGSVDIGGTAQQVTFEDLTDHRGNQLPPAISSPRVIVRPRSEEAVFIVGEETDTQFTIARDSDAASPVTVDLLILEMGN